MENHGLSGASAPFDATGPILVTRTHEVGQRYAIAMTHSAVITNVYDAEATVTQVTEGEIELALMIKSLTSDNDLGGDAWTDERRASGQLVGVAAREGRHYVHFHERLAALHPHP